MDSLKEKTAEASDALDLGSMLRKVFQEEEMKENEKYFCDKCNDYTPLAIKQAYLDTMSNYLILTLNRFWYDFKTQKRNKIMKQIDIPMLLNFGKYKKNNETPLIYEIYAMLIHKVISEEF